MATTDIDAVLAANAAFYRAMREGDYMAMERLWTRRRPVSCTHPGWPAIQGRGAVMQSWRRILLEARPPAIREIDAKPIVTGRSALVLCREEVSEVQMMACNSFVREPRGWRMLSHQASHIPKR